MVWQRKQSSLIDYVWAPAALLLRCSGPLRRLAAELQLISTRQLRDHVPLGLEFDYVQLAGQPASGEREAWNADALMEGVRVGTKRSEFLAALEDRVGAEEARWTPLLELHYPDLLDDYLKKIEKKDVFQNNQIEHEKKMMEEQSLSFFKKPKRNSEKQLWIH